MEGDIEHPAVMIRRTTLMACVGLGLLMRDLWKVRRLAGEALARDRETRLRHARELNVLEDHHLERIRELSAQIAEQREHGFRAAVVADADGDAVEIPIDATE